MFYPADWDPESQAILSAFSALTDQFSSCHVSTPKSEPRGTNFKWKLRFSRRRSLAAPRTAWAATARGLEATSPSPSRSSQIHPDSSPIGENTNFVKHMIFLRGNLSTFQESKMDQRKKTKFVLIWIENMIIVFWTVVKLEQLESESEDFPKEQNI